jgi:glycosyltransferase involved in cell wall biosynthesis
MRVLFFSSIFPRTYRPNLGIYCFHLCNALAAGGHDVRVVSPRSWLERPRPRDDSQPDPLPGLRDLHVDYPGYFYTPGVLRTAYGAFMWASVGKQLKRAIADFRPDCVVSYWAHPDGQTAVRAAGEAGVPSAVMVGGSDVLLLARKAGGRRAKIISVLRAADAVIAVSNHMRDQLVEYGTPAEKVHVVYRGVDGDLFSPGDTAASRARLGVPAEGKVLVAIGNLVPVKGLDVLLNAAGQLRGRGVPFRLYLLGEGASRGALEAQAASLGLTDVVTFVGAVAQRHLPDWYRAADLTVLSSHSEGIPNVLRESMACGTPFVATRVGGIHEIADDPANRLVPPADPAALAEAIEASLAPPSSLRLGAAHASTWADSAQRVVDVMRPLVSSARRGAAATVPATELAAEPELEGAKPS